MNTKFLSDGRKVSVIGKLNNNESIVQEIFVTNDGSEIPSGENFTTKSLHDSPVESYKAREEKRIAASIVKLELSLKESTKAEKAAKQKLKAVAELLKSSQKFAESVGEEGLEIMSQFVTGTIEYLVMTNYRIEAPVKMIDKVFSWNCSYGDTTFEGLKLVSALGKSGGDLEYRIHTYGDGSGSSLIVHPFTTLEGAADKIKEIAIKRFENGYGIDMNEFNVCKDLGIEFNHDHLALIGEKMIESKKKALDFAQVALKKAAEDSAQCLSDISSLNEHLGL